MVSFLKKKGYCVIAIAQSHNDLRRKWHSPADKLILIDLRDASSINLIPTDAKLFYHFAANMGGVGYFSRHQYEPFLDNALMDINVFEYCRKYNLRLFYPSSICAYPIHLQSNEGLTEDMLIPANANEMYGWEKLMMMLVAEKAPFEVRVGVLHTIFGEGQEYEGEKAKFPSQITAKVIKAKFTGKPVEIWGDGNQTRTFLYIDDAIEKIYEVVTADYYYGPVNISGEEVVTVRQCADWLCEFAKIKPKYEFNLSKPTGVVHRGVSNKKFNKYYQYRNRVTIRDGFRRLYEYLHEIYYFNRRQ